MINKPHPSPDVPARLLAAATELFARQGFEEVTTRQIATAAGVTLACINYHFDGKQGLYREALLAAHRNAMGELSGEGGEPEERLRGFIRALVAKVLDGRQVAMRLLARELASPTSALAEVVERSIRPASEHVRRIIGEILGPDADPELVRHAAISVIGQCLHWHHGQPVIARLFPEEAFTPRRIADHIADFTLHGLRGLAGQIRQAKGSP